MAGGRVLARVSSLYYKDISTALPNCFTVSCWTVLSICDLMQQERMNQHFLKSFSLIRFILIELFGALTVLSCFRVSDPKP